MEDPILKAIIDYGKVKWIEGFCSGIIVGCVFVVAIATAIPRSRN